MSEHTTAFKSIPYGISDYGLIRRENYYYVDKTMYLPKVQAAGRYLFFLRPRRFGKSLFLSLMEAYFDVYYKDRFEEFFKGTWIYDNPTDEQGKFLVLTFNFSGVDSNPGKLDDSFLHHIRSRARAFLEKYSGYFGEGLEYTQKTIDKSRSGSDILSAVIDLCKGSQLALYVIIDEYDNFANTILATSGESAYQDLTRGEGFMRSFFNVLKAGTSGMEAPISRLFICGVSPVTMDDVTSGFNIGENISLDSIFNGALGFTRTDVSEMLDYYRSAGLIEHGARFLMEMLTGWYGNYLFSQHTPLDERMFNSDMVLYFLKEYFKNRTIPRDLIDRNVRVDYGKLRHLIIVDRGKGKAVNGNFSKLKELLENGQTSANLAKGFPLEKMIDRDNFASLLFYFGLLTIKSTDLDLLSFSIPNETVSRLFYDYIKEGYEETDVFALDLSTYSGLMRQMAAEGQWRPQKR